MGKNVQVTKFQKGEEKIVLRSQIKEAPYNPRFIGEGAEKRLRRSIRSVGLLGTIIVNENTWHVVSGHQRLKQLDFIEGYPDTKVDYELRVTLVSLDEKQEKSANVLMNNPSVQGEWDFDKLADMVFDSELSAQDMGFTDADINIMFGSDDRFDDLFGYEDPEDLQKVKATSQEIRDARDTSLKEMEQAQSSDFYFVVICQDQKVKDDLLKHFGFPQYEIYVNGARIAKKVGIEIDG